MAKPRGILDRHNSTPLNSLGAKNLNYQHIEKVSLGSSALKRFLFQDPSSKENKISQARPKETNNLSARAKPDSAKIIKNSLTKTVNFRDEEPSNYMEPTTKDSASKIKQLSKAKFL